MPALGVGDLEGGEGVGGLDLQLGARRADRLVLEKPNHLGSGLKKQTKGREFKTNVLNYLLLPNGTKKCQKPATDISE